MHGKERELNFMLTFYVTLRPISRHFSLVGYEFSGGNYGTRNEKLMN